MSFSFQFTLKQIILGLFLTAASGVLPVLLTQAARAQSVTDNLDVTATVKASCKISGVTDVNFGTYDALGTNYATALDTTGSVSVSCLPTVTASIQLKQGTNPATGSTCTAPARQMKGPNAAPLPYGLFKDSARSQVWGCDSSTDVDYTATKATATTFDIYGRIPAAQDLPAGVLDTLEPGAYSDTVQIVVSF
ncbi:spore coat U domain-containing protein [Thermosynechococcaceae cyanobacterium Okahandja]